MNTAARAVRLRSRSSWGAAIVPAAAGVMVFLIWQYAAALWRLAHTADGMDNKFSALARGKYVGFLIGQNLHVLIAYVLLAMAGIYLLAPIVAVLTRKRGLRLRIAAATLLAFATHGFFVLRQMKTRPYFVDEAEFGKWHYKAFELLPEGTQPHVMFWIFSVLPVAVLVWATWWHFHRTGRVARLALVACAAIATATIAWTHWAPRHLPAAAARAPEQPNILIIGSDSLRGDKLGCAGYRPQRRDGAAAAGVSPHIDMLAARSVRFENCSTSIASTLESGIQLMASEYPHSYGIRQMFPCRQRVDQAMAQIDPLASKLAAEGYDTAAIGDWCAGYYEVTPLGFEHFSVSSYDNFRIYMSQAVLLAHTIIPLYFDNAIGYHVFPQIQSFAQFVTPGVVTHRVEDRLRERAADARPFFWHVFYACNHLPYRSGEPYVTMFTDPAYRGDNRSGVDFDINSFIGSTQLGEKWKALPETEVRQIRALYDGCTRSFDDCVGSILKTLKNTGLDQNTIVIITADHGDDLYEPGVTLGHGLTLNGGGQAYHVPMIVHVPGVKPAVIPEAVRLIDVAPTLAEFAGIAPSPKWEGRSFASWMRGTEKPVWRPIYRETGFPFIQFAVPGVERPKLPPMDDMTFIDPSFNYQFVLKPEWEQPLIDAKQRSLSTRDWKIVCTPTADGQRHYALFHMSSDPNAENDLSATRPEVLAAMRTALDAWIDRHIETPVADIFPGGEPE